MKCGLFSASRNAGDESLPHVEQRPTVTVEDGRTKSLQSRGSGEGGKAVAIADKGDGRGNFSLGSRWLLSATHSIGSSISCSVCRPLFSTRSDSSTARTDERSWV